MRVKEESEKVDLKLNIKKTKMKPSCPISSWQIEGGKVEVVTDFLFLGSKITVDSDCNHEIRRWLLLGREAMMNLDHVLKSRDHTADRGSYTQGYGLPSGCEWLWKLDHKGGRAPKKLCLQTVMLEKTPESPLESKEIKPVNLKGNQPWRVMRRTDAEPETPVFGHLMPTPESLENSLMLGKMEGRRKRGHQRMRWLDDITNAMDINLGKLWEMVRKREAWGTSTYGVTKSQTWLGDWTTVDMVVQSHSFACDCPVFLAPFIEESLFFFHLHCWLSCYELTDHTCDICFWVLNSLPLIYVFVLM